MVVKGRRLLGPVWNWFGVCTKEGKARAAVSQEEDEASRPCSSSALLTSRPELLVQKKVDMKWKIGHYADSTCSCGCKKTFHHNFVLIDVNVSTWQPSHHFHMMSHRYCDQSCWQANCDWWCNSIRQSNSKRPHCRQVSFRASNMEDQGDVEIIGQDGNTDKKA